MITVYPLVFFGHDSSAVQVACKADQVGYAPVVVNDLTVKWGRDGYFDRVQPAELTLTLWDSTGDWARRIRDSRALGTNVQVMWEADNSGTRTRGTLFKGMVTNARASRMERTDHAERNVWRIVLTVHDPTSSLGNIYPLPGVLPAQRMHERVEWIKGLLKYGGITIGGIVHQNAYFNAAVVPFEVGKEPASQIMDTLFDAMSADAYCYAPDWNAIFQCERHDGDFSTFLASFDDALGAVMICSDDSVVNNRTRPGIAISGCSIDVGPGITIEATPDTDINRVETTYKRWNGETREYDDVIQASESIAVGQPRRLLNNSCWFYELTGFPGDPSIGLVDLQHRSLWERARAEGRRPKHPNLTYHPGKTFPTERVMKWWLSTYEDARPAFVNGDEAHRWMMDGERDWSPIVSPLGGTVTYNGKDGWDVDLNVQWSHNRLTITPIVWKNLQQFQWTTGGISYPWWWDLLGIPKPPPKPVGSATPERDVRWGAPDGDSGQYRFDTSVTWSDLKYLDNANKQIKDVLK